MKARKQSAETQLRHSKAANKVLCDVITRLKGELALRTTWGQMMSNICFNLAQNESLDAMARQSMKDCREHWDAIKSVQS